MNSNKDIFDSIRENAHQLEERPSKKAWERLEQRLDERTTKRPFSSKRLLSIAATVVGLLGVVAVISFNFQKQNAPVAAQDIPTTTIEEFVVEELEVLSEEERGFYKVVEFQKTYQNRLSKPIIEGSGKRLAVSKHVKRMGE